jgi:hypothetical protein
VFVLHLLVICLRPLGNWAVTIMQCMAIQEVGIERKKERKKEQCKEREKEIKKERGAARAIHVQCNNIVHCLMPLSYKGKRRGLCLGVRLGCTLATLPLLSTELSMFLANPYPESRAPFI